MLTLILMLLLGLVILGGFLFVLTYFSIGTIGALHMKSAMRRDERIRHALETPEAKEAREQREAGKRYLNSLVDRVVSPEDKQAGEKEARRRYLDSLVDR